MSVFIDVCIREILLFGSLSPHPCNSAIVYGGPCDGDWFGLLTDADAEKLLHIATGSCERRDLAEHWRGRSVVLSFVHAILWIEVFLYSCMEYHSIFLRCDKLQAKASKVGPKQIIARACAVYPMCEFVASRCVCT